MPRIFDGLVLRKMKKEIVTNMSKFHIGAKPQHRVQEHLFVLFSMMELYKKLGRNMLLITWDISRYFDRHHLLEAMTWLADANISSKCYRLFWNLNNNTEVKVKTAA